jgi:PIH1 N-terminal domain
MTYHELVDPFEEKPIPKEEAVKLGASEKGIRIPLSLGGKREDSDKKGEPVQVYDFIWNPETVERAKKDSGFRQIMVELAFNYIKTKFDRDLDLRFTVPKMKYKGATI